MADCPIDQLSAIVADCYAATRRGALPAGRDGIPMRISKYHNDGPGPWFTQMDDAPLF